MLIEEQINNLKEGDRLIFVRYGHTLSSDVGNVFTFSNWKYGLYHGPLDRDGKGKSTVQVKEIRYPNHGFWIGHFDLFDSDKHIDYKIMTEQSLLNEEEDFLQLFP